MVRKCLLPSMYTTCWYKGGPWIHEACNSGPILPMYCRPYCLVDTCSHGVGTVQQLFVRAVQPTSPGNCNSVHKLA